MQPLEILQEARNAKLYLLEAEERLQEAESIAEGTRAARYDNTSGRSSTRYYSSSLNALDAAIDNYRLAFSRFINAELQAWLLIDKLPDGQQGKLILFARYCCCRKWADIEQRYNISTCTSHRIHRATLQELAKLQQEAAS